MLKALLATALRKADEAEQRAATVEARLAEAQARQSATEALIAQLKLQIAKLRREQYGPSAERSRRLLEQMELQLEDLEADAGEDDLAAEAAATRSTSVTALERRRPARRPFPEHLPRERVVIPAPCSCPACGSARLSKLGEDVTETLEVIPRSWKVVQTVREKFSCRDCETITQPPAPFHVVPRGWAGPSFLAMLLFEIEETRTSGGRLQATRRPAPAPQPPGRALRPRRRAAEHLDAGGPGRRRCRGADAALPADRGACARGRTPAW